MRRAGARCRGPAKRTGRAAAPASYYRVRRVVEVSGDDIRSASATRQQRPAGLSFSLTPDGGRRFAELTRANIGRQLAIVLDGRVQSAPVIESAITGGEGVIGEASTSREASDLALVLRSGALAGVDDVPGRRVRRTDARV